MRKNIFLMGFVLFGCFCAKAQSKVFKEVSDEISSQIRIITQDNALVGYLVFTQLEKASEDSFNYRLTIMDENLNDIGTVNFREENLDLQSVSFEQDVLCLAYLKSSVIGKQFKNRKAYKAALPDARHEVISQFLNLDGRIIKTNAVKTDINLEKDIYASMGQKLTGRGGLKQNIQLKNIPQKGFACFYGDENNNYLTVYDLTGNQVWKKKITNAKGFYLLTSNDDIYLLSKKDGAAIEGGFELAGYGFAENTTHDKYALKDRKGNQLKVLGFDNDPATGKPYITGTIINPQINGLYKIKDVTKGPYSGVFTININGPKKADKKGTFTYWNGGAYASFVSENGKFAEGDAYSLLEQGFKDYEGNTYFVGSSIIKRTKWGTIASSVILSPLIVVSPMLLMVSGTVKCKITDAMLLKQTPDGKLAYENTIPCNSSSFRPGRAPISMYGPQKTFYRVTNSDTKNDYVIVDDIKDIVIYNITKKKVARTISHKDGSIRTNVFPAKEGHVMVAEYNKKEKYTRFSIESL